VIFGGRVACGVAVAELANAARRADAREIRRMDSECSTYVGFGPISMLVGLTAVEESTSKK
jgi:hypothetical protein